MEVLRTINDEAQAAGLRFLVVGGHAVIAHGYGRTTADLDLMIVTEEAEQQVSIINAMGWKLVRRTRAAIQWDSTTGAMPLDLLLTGRDSFNKLYASKVEVEIAPDLHVQIPEVRHLIAMKLHGIKQAGVLRELHDMQDIVELIMVYNIDAIEGNFKDFCIRYGARETYEQIVRETSARRS